MTRMENVLSDGVIGLRALEPSDLDWLYRHENDASLWSVGVTIAPYSRKQLWDYIENYDGDIYSARQLRMMVSECETGEVIGALDLFDFDPVNRRCSIGLLIDVSRSSHGYGRRTMKIVENYARACLGLHQLWCIIPQDNAACRRLFDTLGYKISGCLKSWLRRGESYADAYVYQLIL
ncbi:MAG: GNAT family N-acetyltransferase [Muribaculaceae bacterium]|nr:GNAT family N-acetyltransferase [Muribaculaceae bacterium]